MDADVGLRIMKCSSNNSINLRIEKRSHAYWKIKIHGAHYVRFKEKKTKTQLIKMKPSDIYYSQDSINVEFDNGYTIYSTLSACRKHPFVINKISPIRICQINGRWYTLDNRRLWVFKQLEEEGHISSVSVQHVSRNQLPDRKFTTTNEGESVEIRHKFL